MNEMSSPLEQGCRVPVPRRTKRKSSQDQSRFQRPNWVEGVLQGGATEMSIEHRPLDETVSDRINKASPAYGTESERAC